MELVKVGVGGEEGGEVGRACCELDQVVVFRFEGNITEGCEAALGDVGFDDLFACGGDVCKFGEYVGGVELLEHSCLYAALAGLTVVV